MPAGHVAGLWLSLSGNPFVNLDKIDFSGHFDEMPQNSFWPQVNFGKFTPHEINSLRLGERSEQDRSEQA